jgi:hypothetical protein
MACILIFESAPNIHGSVRTGKTTPVWAKSFTSIVLAKRYAEKHSVGSLDWEYGDFSQYAVSYYCRYTILPNRGK